MIEVAEVFRRFAADYLDAYGATILPSHQGVVEGVSQALTDRSAHKPHSLRISNSMLVPPSFLYYWYAWNTASILLSRAAAIARTLGVGLLAKDG